MGHNTWFDALVILLFLAGMGINTYGIFYHDRLHTWYRIVLFTLSSVGLLALAGAARLLVSP